MTYVGMCVWYMKNKKNVQRCIRKFFCVYRIQYTCIELFFNLFFININVQVQIKNKAGGTEIIFHDTC